MLIRRLLTLILILLFTSTVFAGDDKKEKPTALLTESKQMENKQSSTKQIGSSKNIVLLMDSSGSMRKTDPKNYRKVAAKLFTSLIGEDVKISILSFGDTVKTLLPLSDNKKSLKPAIDKAIDKISSKEFSTHIHLAVKEGFEILKKTKEGTGIIILMSDGKLTLGSESKDKLAKEELLKMLPEIAKAGIKIYTIPFTEESDIALLNTIANETGGFSRLAKTDKDIHMLFASIFEKIKSPDSIPIRDDGFSIDAEIKEAILIITKQPKTKTTLVTPSGTKINYGKHGKNILWHSTDLFDMITITSPQIGQWKVNLSTKEGNRVYVLTNLRLKSSFDKNLVYIGEKLTLDAWLERDGGIIKEMDVLDKITIIAESSDPSKTPKKINMVLDSLVSGTVPTQGKYMAELLIEHVGDYTVKIIAEGSTFKREKILEFRSEEMPPEKVQPIKREKPDKTEQKTEVNDPSKEWKSSLIIFGVANGTVLLIGGLVFLVLKLLKKRSRKKK
ncbi:MAG TPA: VWA domain-containing protein [Nitrospirae bacterium]|nr:VWA domain-containing protein [Nitrospirota bacterium]